MLYQIGPLTLDTFPFSINAADHAVAGDYAKHDLLSRRRGYEPMGEGDETLDLTGEVLPVHIGGLSEIEYAMDLTRTQVPVFVMRGDGLVIGWCVLMSVRARHGGKDGLIAPDGVGYVVGHEIKLERSDDPGETAGASAITALVSLFG